MRARHVGWISTTLAVACLLLVSGSASADKYKSGHGKGKGKGKYAKSYDRYSDRHYDRGHDRHYGKRYDKHYRKRYGRHYDGRHRHGDDFWGYLYYDSYSRAWSGHVTWQGEIGGVGVRLEGGRGYYPAPVYRPVRYYAPRYRYPRRLLIPAGHLPPPGACRVWYPDRPPGHQPPPTSCHRAEHQAHRYGGIVIYGGSRY